MPEPKKHIPPHPLNYFLGRKCVKERRNVPDLAGEIVLLMEKRGVPWKQAIADTAGLMAQTVEEVEGWWAFHASPDGDLTDDEMIAKKRSEA